MHFSKVFGHSPAATHLSPPLEPPGDQTLADGQRVNQSAGALYFVPEDSQQDEVSGSAKPWEISVLLKVDASNEFFVCVD